MMSLQNARQSGVNLSEAIAVRALGFVCGDQSVREQFLARSTVRLSDLGRQPIDADCLVAALDFLIGNEAALLKFAEILELPPEATYDARRRVVHGMSEIRSHSYSTRAGTHVRI
jgi:hypothetical protein